MKSFIISIIALFMCCFASNAQTQDVTFRREGKTYSSSSSKKQTTEKATGFTWEDSKGNTYDIYMGPSGSCYIKRISAKTGKEYKQYLGAEISQDICNQLGVKYTPKNSNSGAN